VSASEIFLGHAQQDRADSEVAELRRNLTQLKMEALAAVEGLDEGGLSLVIPGLYAQLVLGMVDLASHVGLGVALALEAVDEHRADASISCFKRDVRDRMAPTGVELKRKVGDGAKIVADVEAQRLAWRHTHEFLSWLAFHRQYTPADRKARFEGYRLLDRLLAARMAMRPVLGAPLAIALEGHDRFMLSHRARPEPDEEHRLELFAWSLLSYQPETVVKIEIARYEYDALERENATAEVLEKARRQLDWLLQQQLAEALGQIPPALESPLR
jgi:hypothetical protein